MNFMSVHICCRLESFGCSEEQAKPKSTRSPRITSLARSTITETEAFPANQGC